MAITTVLPQGATAAQLAAETGPARGLVVDTTNWQLKLLDASTPGGRAIGGSGNARYVSDAAVPETTPAERIKHFPTASYAMTAAQKADADDNRFSPTIAMNDAAQRMLTEMGDGDRIIIDRYVRISGSNADPTTRLFITKPNLTLEFTSGGALIFDDTSGAGVNSVRYLCILANGVRLIGPRIRQLNLEARIRTVRAAIHVGDESGSLIGVPIDVDGFECWFPDIDSTCGAGILLDHTRFFRIVGGVIRNTLADGVHISRFCEYGHVVGLTVDHSGDDGFAIVGNIGSEGPCRHIAADGLTIRDTGARGVSILGGEDVSVLGAVVENTSGANFALNKESSTYDLRPSRRVTVTGRGRGAGLGYDNATASNKDGLYVGAGVTDLTVDLDIEGAMRNVAFIGDPAIPIQQLPSDLKGAIRGRNCRNGISVADATNVKFAELDIENCGGTGVNFLRTTKSRIGRISLRHNNINRLANNVANLRLKTCTELTIGRVDAYDQTWRLPFDPATKTGYFPAGSVVTGGTSGATGVVLIEHDNWSGTSTNWLVITDPVPATPNFNAADALTARITSPVDNPGAFTIANGATATFRLWVPGLLADAAGVTFVINHPTAPTPLAAGVTTSATIAEFEAVDVVITNGSGSSKTIAAGNWHVVGTVGTATMNAAQATGLTSTQIYIDADCVNCSVDSGRARANSGVEVDNNSTTSDVSISGAPPAHTSGTVIDLRGMQARVVTMGAATNVTALDNVPEAKPVTLVFTNGNTTLVHGASLQMRGAVNVTPTAGQVLTFSRIGTVVYETGR